MFSIYENNKGISGACRSFVLCLDYEFAGNLVFTRETPNLKIIASDERNCYVKSMHDDKSSGRENHSVKARLGGMQAASMDAYAGKIFTSVQVPRCFVG